MMSIASSMKCGKEISSGIGSEKALTALLTIMSGWQRRDILQFNPHCLMRFSVPIETRVQLRGAE